MKQKTHNYSGQWRVRRLQLLTTFLVLFFSALLLADLQSALAAAVDSGYRDFSYTGASAPTGQKPQSKLWHHDGFWWGSLFNKASGKFEIYRFNWSDHSWATTNTALDPRRRSSADVLWDGSFLYVVSAIPPGLTGDISIYFMRYSYNSANKTYSLDSGFPISLGNRVVESAVMDKDTTGKVWVTFTDSNGSGGRSVFVMHSTTDDLTWTEPYIIPTAGTNNLHSDDTSAAVSFNGKIGVMWSNQNDNILYFAIHQDGAPDGEWSLNPALQGPKYADDHMNLKSLVADESGQVFAAVKTSLNDLSPSNPDDPLILLLTLDLHGSWSRRTFSRVADDHTRPIVLVDNQNRQVYVFATVPVGSPTSGAIYYKSVSLDNRSMQFTGGLGTPFMLSSQDTHINNSSSTKQPVNSSTGLMVIAGDDTSKYYFHNTIDLGQPPATATSAPSVTPTVIIETPTVVPPTATETPLPTLAPTGTPTGIPTETPTENPTETSTESPTDTPTENPTITLTPDFTSTPGEPTSTATETPVTPPPAATETATEAAPTSTSEPIPTETATAPADTPTPEPAPTETSLPSPTPEPVTLFADGFESGDFAAWTVVKTGTDGQAAVQSDIVRSGSYAAMFSATANTGSLAYARKSLENSPTTISVSGDFMVTMEGIKGGNVPIIRLYNTQGTRVVNVFRLNLNRNKVNLQHSGSYHDTQGTLALNTWGHFEVVVTVNADGPGTIRVFLEGNQIYETNAANLGASGIQNVQIGNETAKQTFQIYADNILVTR